MGSVVWHRQGMDLLGLEAVQLNGSDGRLHRLGDFWADRAVILVFLRHFG